jgi:Flp pilus assembly pilin Flp
MPVEEGIMVTWLRRLFKNERGQALAEYQVLYPGSILMVLAVFVLIAEPVKGMYCDAVNVFSNGICASSPSGDIEEPTPEPTEEAQEEECVVLQEYEGCSQCDAHENCMCLPGVNAGTHNSLGIEALVIKAGRDYHVYSSSTTDDGCYEVTFNPDDPDPEVENVSVSWERVGNGSGCKDISHLQSWRSVLCVD